MEFKQAQLPNGLKIVGEINPDAATLAVGLFVRTGSRDETAQVAGVSHFLEHMMFKGTDRRTAFDINREFDEMGAHYNAFTAEENTVYFGAVLPEFQDRLLDLLGDMLRPALREDDFDTEKNVILEEIALYDDRPHFRLYEKLMARHFAGHPLGNSILGTRESITDLKRGDMCAYFDRRYSPSNVTLVGVGKIDWGALTAEAEPACGHWTDHEAPRDLAPSAQDEDRYAASLAATILGDTTGSRLFYALVEPAIADEAHCASECLDGTGAFLTFVATDPGRAGQALTIVRDELKRFRDEGPTEQEMTAARNKIASSATLKGELPMGRLTAVGFDWVYRRHYRSLAEHLERIMSVTVADVLDVARKHDLARTTVLGLGPNETL
ncbi:MAG: M16 family metallopeptidase [Planctomycetota bacterium]|jgi:predicted Zn-dependent peptidase